MIRFRDAYALVTLFLCSNMSSLTAALDLTPNTLTTLATKKQAHASVDRKTVTDLLEKQKHDFDSRNLQATLKSNYVGRFSTLLDNSCIIVLPQLRASCRGEIEVLRTSDPTIVCSPLSAQESEPGWNEVRCINTCENQARCDSIFLNVGGSYDADVYGEIFFSCTGESVDARFIFEDTIDGRCGSGDVFGDARNFRLAQLGVFCSDLGIGGDFAFSALYDECGLGTATLDVKGKYTCIAGENCRNCDNIDFPDVLVSVDEHYLKDTCITSVDGGPIPPRPAPEPVQSPGGEYTARFQANFGMGFNEFDCEESPPQLRATCTNGEIEFLGGLADSVSCETEGTSALLCTDSDMDNYYQFQTSRLSLNQEKFSGFVYVCKASQVPETTVEFLANDMTCDSTSDDILTSALLLGVFCGDPAAGGDYSYYEYYFECLNSWDRDPGEEFECFATTSQKNGDVTIPQVTMFTDNRWSEAASQGISSQCFTFQEAAPTTPPTLPPTSPPTDLPSTVPSASPSGPTALPSFSPSADPTSSAIPTVPQGPDPTPMPTDDPEGECFRLEDGSIACALVGQPAPGFTLVLFNCPTFDPTFGCEGCLISADADGDGFEAEDPLCTSCTVCDSEISFNCLNVASGDCATVNCEGTCTNTPEPTVAPQPLPTPFPVPAPSDPPVAPSTPSPFGFPDPPTEAPTSSASTVVLLTSLLLGVGVLILV